jgi:hypothetical protein
MAWLPSRKRCRLAEEDKQLTLRFPSAAPTSLFHMGAAATPELKTSVLWLRDLSIQRSDSHQQKPYACAASEATNFWMPRDPHADDCVTAPKLRATALRARHALVCPRDRPGAADDGCNRDYAARCCACLAIRSIADKWPAGDGCNSVAQSRSSAGCARLRSPRPRLR